MDIHTEPRKALTAATARIREIFSDVPARGLDKVIEELEDLLVSLWSLEAHHTFAVPDGGESIVPRLFEAFQSPMKKLAPPPPKKIKRDTPLRKILPLSESHVARAIDSALLVHALAQIGDFTEQTDKARGNHLHLLDDWRRMIWESARVGGWDAFRKLAAGEPSVNARVPGLRFSRAVFLTLLEAVAKNRADLITPVPSLSMFACRRCRRFEGRERIRCATCFGLFCGRCVSRSGSVCLGDYAARYTAIPRELRSALQSGAAGLCASYRLDEYTRNEMFARALAEEGVEVVFSEDAPEAGEETQDGRGFRKLRVRDREGPTTKRIFFTSLARCWFRSKAMEPDPNHEAYFIDTCLKLPLEEILAPQAPAAAQ